MSGSDHGAVARARFAIKFQRNSRSVSLDTPDAVALLSRIASLEAAATDVLINYGMGWELDGVMATLRALLPNVKPDSESTNTTEETK